MLSYYSIWRYNLEYSGIHHKSPQSYKVDNIYCVCFNLWLPVLHLQSVILSDNKSKYSSNSKKLTTFLM